MFENVEQEILDAEFDDEDTANIPDILNDER